VTLDYEGEGDPSVWIGGEEMSPTPCPNVRQVLEAPATTTTVFSLGLEEPEPPPKKACTKGCLPPSTWYVHV
jgi:hypothetical protein